MLDRRRFLSYLPAATLSLGAAGICKSAAAAPEYGTINAIETLMRGHGLLMRALSAYDILRERIAGKVEIEPSWVIKTTGVIRDYLETFHEPMEEKYIFAPMEKARVHEDSIQELKVQHGTGLELTTRIRDLAKSGKLQSELHDYMNAFGRMYKYHSGWEDTVIFPAFEALENNRRLAELSATLELEEKNILGTTGFDSFVKEIAEVEKGLGTYGPQKWTPKI